MTPDLSWSEDSRQTHNMHLKLDGSEWRILREAASRVPLDPEIGTNKDIHALIRCIINGSVDSGDFDTIEEPRGPDSRANVRLTVSDEEYQRVRDSINRHNLRPTDYNKRPLCQKARQEFVIPFIQEVER